MIGKLLSHILGNMEADGGNSVHIGNGEDLLEYDDGEWIIINIHGESNCMFISLHDLLQKHSVLAICKFQNLIKGCADSAVIGSYYIVKISNIAF